MNNIINLSSSFESTAGLPMWLNTLFASGRIRSQIVTKSDTETPVSFRNIRGCLHNSEYVNNIGHPYL